MQTPEIIKMTKTMGISMDAFNDFLERSEKLSPKQLNLLAMEMLNRASMKLEDECPRGKVR